jgi:hypothetical protein
VLPKIVDKPTSCAGEIKNDTIKYSVVPTPIPTIKPKIIWNVKFEFPLNSLMLSLGIFLIYK